MEKIDIEKLGHEVFTGELNRLLTLFDSEVACIKLAEKINEIVDWCNNLDSYLKHKEH